MSVFSATLQSGVAQGDGFFEFQRTAALEEGARFFVTEDLGGDMHVENAFQTRFEEREAEATAALAQDIRAGGLPSLRR